MSCQALSKASGSPKHMKSNASHVAIGRSTRLVYRVNTRGKEVFSFILVDDKHLWTRRHYRKMGRYSQCLAVTAPTSGNNNSTVVAHVGSRNTYSDISCDFLATYHIHK